jgi:hypothetical protein
MTFTYFSGIFDAGVIAQQGRNLSGESWIEFLENRWYTGTAICARIFDDVNHTTRAEAIHLPATTRHVPAGFIPAAGSRDSDLRPAKIVTLIPR